MFLRSENSINKRFNKFGDKRINILKKDSRPQKDSDRRIRLLPAAKQRDEW